VGRVGTALAKVSADLTPALDKARVLDEQIAPRSAAAGAAPAGAGRIVTVAVNAAPPRAFRYRFRTASPTSVGRRSTTRR